MPKYYGCPCEGCGKPLTLQDDIVVCPDCGAPYHRVCSVLSFVLMLVRGMYGKWLYRKSAADHIRRIQSEFPDAQQRQAVLRAQGGVSFGAVFLCVLLLSVCGSAFTLLLGPDLQAILNAFYG